MAQEYTEVEVDDNFQLGNIKFNIETKIVKVGAKGLVEEEVINDSGGGDGE